MSVDRRLRAGLHRTAETLASDPFGALDQVEAKARRRQRRAVAARVAVATLGLAGLAVTVPFVVRDNGTGQTVTVGQPDDPSGLAGSYTVDVAPSALADQHRMVGRWVIELTEDGTVTMQPPAAFSGATSASFQATGHRLSTDAFVNDLCVQAQATTPLGTYRWEDTGSGLRFVAETETCGVRQLLFTGQEWSRR